MKVLITGAAGFIGSQLAYRLWKNGEEVILVDNFSYGKKDNLVFEDHDFNNEISVIWTKWKKSLRIIKLTMYTILQE